MASGPIHDLVVSFFKEETMRHPIFGPVMHFFGNVVDACGMMILAVTGMQVAGTPDGVSTPIPSSATAIPSIFTTGGVITWIVIGGGSVWAIRQVGELVKTVTFALRSGWITAAAGTDHQRAVDCEQQRLLAEQTIQNLRNDLMATLAISAAKDSQIRGYNSQIVAKDSQIVQKDELIRQMNRDLMGLSRNVSENNGKIMDAAQKVAETVQVVQIDPTAEPVRVVDVTHTPKEE
jgi:hypothetical protein